MFSASNIRRLVNIWQVTDPGGLGQWKSHHGTPMDLTETASKIRYMSGNVASTIYEIILRMAIASCCHVVVRTATD